MPRNLANSIIRRTFQTVELSQLIQEKIQCVPEGVWLELVPSGQTQLNLKVYRLGTKNQVGQANNSDLQLESCDEQVLSAQAPYTLQPSQFFQLNAAQQNDASTISGIAEFATTPSLYFNKKFNSSNGLGQAHSEAAYFKAYYSHLHPEFRQRSLQVLDLGCGRGRNAVLFAGDLQNDFHVLGLDRSADSLSAWNAMAEAEGLTDNGKFINQQVDFNSWYQVPAHDISMAIVSLQFLQAESAIRLLQQCMAESSLGALHLSVFPIASTHPSSITWPNGFHFLPQSEEVKYLFMQQGWSILEYRESYGHLGKVDKNSLPIRGVFATLIAQKAF